MVFLKFRNSVLISSITCVSFQEADRHVVNCVQPHPYEPLIASSGIDYNVKLWAPISNELTFDEVAAKTVLHLIKDFYLNY